MVGLLLKGWEVKKQSQDIIMKEITPEDIMGRMGLYIFFFYPPSANCCLHFYRYYYIKGTKGQINLWLER